MNYRNLLFVLLLLLSFDASSQTENSKKVLFVGNSYTYFWNLPQTVALMAESQKVKLETSHSTAGGAHWGHHWRGERDLQTRDRIKEGDFDVVVLQNHSRSTIDRLDSLMHFGQLLAGKIQEKKAAIYLYMTWAREWDPYMQQPIKEGYEQLAKKINATIVPVGPAWERARTLRPGFPLYDDDGSHSSPLGTYLSACVFYGVLTGQSPIGLPNRLITKDAQGETLYLNIQSNENALFCQKVAAEIIAQYKN